MSNRNSSSSDDEKPTPSRAPASRAPPTMLQGRDAAPPASRAPASRAPPSALQQGLQASRAPASRAPPTMLQGRDSALPASLAPASHAPPTMLQGRDYAPPASRAPASRAPPTMLQGRDSAPPDSRAPASRAPPTMLQGRDSAPPASRAPASRAPPTMLQGRDNAPPTSRAPTLSPSVFASRAPAGLASVFFTEEDMARALKQTCLEELPEDEREKQEAWAQAQIARVTNCPQGHKFKRIPYQGYQCTGGGHGISDHLLAEGLGGLLVIENKGREEHEWTFFWEDMVGPYYSVLGFPGKFNRAKIDQKKLKELEEKKKKEEEAMKSIEEEEEEEGN